MAGKELAASINVSELGLGQGAIETGFQVEMVVLTREIRDAMVEQSRVARKDSFFGEDSKMGIKGVITGAIASALPAIAAVGVGLALPGSGKESEFGNNNFLSNEENINTVLEDQALLKEKVALITADGIITQTELLELEQLKSDLMRDEDLLKEKLLDNEKETFAITSDIYEGLGNNALLLEDINSLLTDGVSEIDKQVASTETLVKSIMDAVAAQEKLNRARGRASRGSSELVSSLPTGAAIDNIVSGGSTPLTPTTGFHQFG
jgi:hypothetical protein